MDISGIMGAQQQTAQNNTKPNGELGKDEFLQLLVAQLRHQDPLNPMDGTEFATQLAQFNSVEQLINLNEGIEGLAYAQEMMGMGLNNSLAATLTGKTVTVMSDQVGFDGSDASDIHFRLQNVADNVEVEIRDSSGNVVRTESLGSLGDGDHNWEWDGKTTGGQTVAEGTYSFKVSALNDEESVQVLSFVEGVVDKVRFTGNGVKLLVNGVLLPLEDVEQIGV